MPSFKSEPSTPDNMKFLAGNGGAINKSLLTPCRRVGLSRKSKTPLQGIRNNSVVSSIEKIISPVSHATTHNQKSSVTPETEQPTMSERNDNNSSNTEVIDDKNNKSAVKSTLNRKNTKVVKNIQNQDSCGDENLNNKKNKRKSEKTQKNVDDLCKISNPDKSNNFPEVDPDGDDIPIKKSRLAKRRLLDDDDDCGNETVPSTSKKSSDSTISADKKVCKSSTQISPLKENVDNKQLKIVLEKCDTLVRLNKTNVPSVDSKMTNTLQRPKNKLGKTVKRCLSLKSNSTCSQNESDFDDLFAKANESATNSPMKETNSSLDDPYCNIISSDTDTVMNVNRATTSQSSDEEDFQPSPEFVNDLTNKIKVIKKRIQEKEQEVNKLKQAEIYKKLHKTEELKQLTSVWKIGCKRALQDLHRLASATDSTIGMPDLLQKLNVPSEAFTCTPNGTLI